MVAVVVVVRARSRRQFEHQQQQQQQQHAAEVAGIAASKPNWQRGKARRGGQLIVVNA